MYFNILFNFLIFLNSYYLILIIFLTSNYKIILFFHQWYFDNFQILSIFKKNLSITLIKSLTNFYKIYLQIYSLFL